MAEIPRRVGERRLGPANRRIGDRRFSRKNGVLGDWVDGHKYIITTIQEAQGKARIGRLTTEVYIWNQDRTGVEKVPKDKLNELAPSTMAFIRITRNHPFVGTGRAYFGEHTNPDRRVKSLRKTD
jgi:hypothetical protein